MTEGVLADSRCCPRDRGYRAGVCKGHRDKTKPLSAPRVYRSGMAMLERHCSAGVPLDGILGNPLESRGILCVLRR